MLLTSPLEMGLGLINNNYEVRISMFVTVCVCCLSDVAIRWHCLQVHQLEHEKACTVYNSMPEVK